VKQSILCGLIGAGIQCSRSPALHQAEARAQGLDLVYKLIDLDVLRIGNERCPAAGGRRAQLQRRSTSLSHCSRRSCRCCHGPVGRGARDRAVNTVVIAGEKLTGHNTDASGWAWGFKTRAAGVDLSRVLLLGAGGAAPR